MITLKLEPEQFEILQAAIEVAMENESDSGAYGEFAELLDLVIEAQDRFYA